MTGRTRSDLESPPLQRAKNASFATPYRRRKPMTFDELWRLNLDRERASVDSVDKAEAVGLIAVPG